MKKRKKLHHVFVDLEKAFDRVPGKVIEWALRRQKSPERLVRIVMCLYAGSRLLLADIISCGENVGTEKDLQRSLLLNALHKTSAENITRSQV